MEKNHIQKPYVQYAEKYYKTILKNKNIIINQLNLEYIQIIYRQPSVNSIFKYMKVTIIDMEKKCVY